MFPKSLSQFVFAALPPLSHNSAQSRIAASRMASGPKLEKPNTRPCSGGASTNMGDKARAPIPAAFAASAISISGLRQNFCDQMQTLFRRGDGEAAVPMRLKRLDQNIARGLHTAAHPAQMGREMSLAQKFGQRGFGQGRRKAIGARPHRQHGIQQRLRRHQIAGAQSRKQDLGESADIGDAARAIHALQSGERRPAITEFAVVIVLDDPGLLRRAQSSSARRRRMVMVTPRGN